MPLRAFQQATVNADRTLTIEIRIMLEKLLMKHAHAFSSGPENMGRTKLIYQKIDIGDNGPVRL